MPNDATRSGRGAETATTIIDVDGGDGWDHPRWLDHSTRHVCCHGNLRQQLVGRTSASLPLAVGNSMEFLRADVSVDRHCLYSGTHIRDDLTNILTLLVVFYHNKVTMFPRYSEQRCFL